MNDQSKLAGVIDDQVNNSAFDKKAETDRLTELTSSQPDYATEELRAAFEDVRSALNSGQITEEGIRRIAAVNDINVDEMMRFAKMSRLDMEKDPYYKSDLSNVPSTNMINIDGHPKFMYPRAVNGDGEKTDGVVEAAGVKLTLVEDNDGKGDIIRCESDYLGDFEYNSDDYSVEFKPVEEDDGSTSYLPVLKYIGEDEVGFQTENAIQDAAEACASYADDQWSSGHYIKGALGWISTGVTSIAATPGNLINGAVSGFDDNQTVGFDQCKIPDGVKVLDYTFEGKDNLQHFPRSIPESVVSMHAAFKGCSRMTVDTRFYETPRIELPDGVQDMSLAFKDCSNLQAEYVGFDEDHIPSQVVNITECWCGCESMSGDKIRANDERGYRNVFISRMGSAEGLGGMTSSQLKCDLPNFGGDLTPYLSAAMARDCLSGISGRTDKEAVKQYVDNIEYVVGYNGQITDKFKEMAKELDQDKLDKTQTAATVAYQGDSHLGSIMTRPELASGGARSDNKMMNEDGTFSYDPTGLRNSFQDHQGITAEWWEKLALYGGTFLAGTLATDVTSRALTKGKVHNIYANMAGGALATLGMTTAFPRLYDSMYPVLNWTRNLLPAGELKNKLSDFIDEHCPMAAVEKINAEVREKNKEWDDEYSVASAFISGKNKDGEDVSYTSGETKHVKSPLADIFDRAGNMAYMWQESDLDTLMKNSSASCASTTTFLALATYRDPNAEEENTFKDCTGPVNESIETATNSIEEVWKKVHETGEWSDDDIRKDMKDYYSTMLHAITVFDESAVPAIGEEYTIGTRDYRLASEGLSMVNKSYMDTLTKSMQEMDAEFHFMDDEMRSKLAGMHLTGVNINGLDSVERVIPDTYAEDRSSFWDDRDGKVHIPLVSDDKVVDQTQSEPTTDATSEPAATTSVPAESDTTAPTSAEPVSTEPASTERELPTDDTVADESEQSADEPSI